MRFIHLRELTFDQIINCILINMIMIFTKGAVILEFFSYHQLSDFYIQFSFSSDQCNYETSNFRKPHKINRNKNSIIAKIVELWNGTQKQPKTIYPVNFNSISKHM